MKKYIYEYKCYKYLEFLYGTAIINSQKEHKDVEVDIKDYINKNIDNKYCLINLEKIENSNSKKEYIKHYTKFKLPISYAVK